MIYMALGCWLVFQWTYFLISNNLIYCIQWVPPSRGYTEYLRNLSVGSKFIQQHALEPPHGGFWALSVMCMLRKSTLFLESGFLEFVLEISPETVYRLQEHFSANQECGFTVHYSSNMIIWKQLQFYLVLDRSNRYLGLLLTFFIEKCRKLSE